MCPNECVFVLSKHGTLQKIAAIFFMLTGLVRPICGFPCKEVGPYIFGYLAEASHDYISPIRSIMNDKATCYI